MNTSTACCFTKLMVVDESISRNSIAYHLHGTEQFHLPVYCFFTSTTDSLYPKTASLGQMVENCVNHVTLDPECLLKLLFQEARSSTNPVTENAGLRPCDTSLSPGGQETETNETVCEAL
jgi:hypothetical protein